MRGAHQCSGTPPPISEMTYTVLNGTLKLYYTIPICFHCSVGLTLGKASACEIVVQHLKGFSMRMSPGNHGNIGRLTQSRVMHVCVCLFVPVFGMLLGDTLLLDTLEDASSYRQEV